MKEVSFVKPERHRETYWLSSLKPYKAPKRKISSEEGRNELSQSDLTQPLTVKVSCIIMASADWGIPTSGFIGLLIRLWITLA